MRLSVLIGILVLDAATGCESSQPLDPGQRRIPSTASEVRVRARADLENGYPWDHWPACPMEYVEFAGRFCRAWRMLPDLTERPDLPVATCHVLWILRSHTRCTVQTRGKTHDLPR